MTKKLRNEDLSFIENLIELLKKNDLTNLEISRDEGDDRGISIRLSQQSTSLFLLKMLIQELLPMLAHRTVTRRQ